MSAARKAKSSIVEPINLACFDFYKLVERHFKASRRTKETLDGHVAARVTRCVCEKIAQNVAQPIFGQNQSVICT
jgi:hypothetical protein